MYVGYKEKGVLVMIVKVGLFTACFHQFCPWPDIGKRGNDLADSTFYRGVALNI